MYRKKIERSTNGGNIKMRKSNIIIKKVKNLMILSMAVIVIISVYFNILNSRAKETTDIVANVTDETGEVDS